MREAAPVSIDSVVERRDKPWIEVQKATRDLLELISTALNVLNDILSKYKAEGDNDDCRDSRIPQSGLIMPSRFDELITGLKECKQKSSQNRKYLCGARLCEFLMESIERFSNLTRKDFIDQHISLEEWTDELKDIRSILENYILTPLGFFVFLAEDIIKKSDIPIDPDPEKFFSKEIKIDINTGFREVNDLKDFFDKRLNNVLIYFNLGGDNSEYKKYFDIAWEHLDNVKGEEFTKSTALQKFKKDFLAALGILFKQLVKKDENTGNFVYEDNIRAMVCENVEELFYSFSNFFSYRRFIREKLMKFLDKLFSDISNDLRKRTEEEVCFSD